MKAIVRDDIVGLETFVQTRFKYEKYIEEIYQCGGYCFLDQLDQHFADIDGRYLAKKLEENNLVILENYNNYKFLRLTDTAIKYLVYKDDQRDFSDKKKSEIPIKKLRKNPSHKVLFQSVYKFQLTNGGTNDKIFKKNIIKNFKKVSDAEGLKTKIEKTEEELKGIRKEKNELDLFFKKYFNNVDILVQEREIKDAQLDNLRAKIEDLSHKVDNNKNILNSMKEERRELHKLREEKSKLETEIVIANKLNEDIYKIKKDISDLNKKENSLSQILKQTQKELEIKKPLEDKLIQAVLNLHDRSKVIPLLKLKGYTSQNREINGIDFIITDLDSLKSKNGYVKLIEGFIKTLNQVDFKTDVIRFLCFTYNENRKERMEGILRLVKESLDHTFKTKSLYEKLGYEGREVVTLEPTTIVYDNIENYKKTPSEKIGYVKEADLDTFRNLQERFKTK